MNKGTRLDVQRRRDARREKRRNRNVILAKMYGTGRMGKTGPVVQDIPRDRGSDWAKPYVDSLLFMPIGSIISIVVSRFDARTSPPVPESHRVNAPGVVELTKTQDGTYE